MSKASKSNQHITLALVSTIPFFLAACDNTPEEQTRTVTNKKVFNSVQDCVDNKVPQAICQNSFIQANNEHLKVAPTYKSEDDCEAVFMKDQCAVNLDNLWAPKLAGFEITESHIERVNGGNVVQSTTPQAAPVGTTQAPATTGGTTVINNTTGGGSSDGFVTGLLIGNMMGNSGPNYYSQPVYVERTSRGDYTKSTISERVNRGESFAKSTQAAQGWDYKQKSMSDALANRAAQVRQTATPRPAASTYRDSVFGSSSYGSKSSFTAYNSGSRVSANSGSISRGGFGGGSSARGGFGG